MSDTKRKYAVISFYNYNCQPAEDWVRVCRATNEMLDEDGTNWVGSSDAYSLDCYDTIQEAMENANFWFSSITYDEAFDDDEKKDVVEYINQTLTREYIEKHYPYRAEHNDYKEKYTVDDLKFA